MERRGLSRGCGLAGSAAALCQLQQVVGGALPEKRTASYRPNSAAEMVAEASPKAAIALPPSTVCSEVQQPVDGARTASANSAAPPFTQNCSCVVSRNRRNSSRASSLRIPRLTSSGRL